MMPDIAVFIERLLKDLIGLADERRRDDAAVFRGRGIVRVAIQRIVVVERKRKISDRAAASSSGAV